MSQAVPNPFTYSETHPIRRTIRKRGRPKTERPKHDTGTDELVQKRLYGETTEALDLCLTRRLICEQQHWCGIHLRWLYTLRHGTPSIQATRLVDHPTGTHAQCSQEWQEAREKEYLDAITELAKRGLEQQILQICVFNEKPSFLRNNRPLTNAALHKANELKRFQEGLDILVTCWCKKQQD